MEIPRRFGFRHRIGHPGVTKPVSVRRNPRDPHGRTVSGASQSSPKSRLHHRRRPHSGTGRRRQYRHLQRGQSGAAQSPALPRSGAPGENRRDRSGHPGRPNGRFHHHLGPARPQPFLREPLPLSVCVGRDRRRRQSGTAPRPPRQRGLFRYAGREDGARPSLSGRRGPARPPLRGDPDQRFVDAPLRRGPRNPRPQTSIERGRIHRGGRAARRLSNRRSRTSPKSSCRSDMRSGVPKRAAAASTCNCSAASSRESPPPRRKPR